MTTCFTKGSRQAGLTLVELMVALVLGLLLMAGVLQLFAANKQSFRLTEELSRMQEGARYATNLLERSIRMAGYLGCTGRQREFIVINNKLSSPPAAFSPEAGIEGWETSSVNTAYGSYAPISDASVSDASTSGWSTGGATSPVLDPATNSVANSDVLRVWHVDGAGVIADISGSTIEAQTTPAYAGNDVMMLTDCQSVDVVQVCSMSGDDAILNCGANSSPSDLLNSDGAHAFKLAGWVYYVGKRGGTATNPPSLFRREISANATAGNEQELVEGVESLQLLYGEDTDTANPDGVADRYVTANNVADWNNVVSVRVHLLMQSDRTDIVEGSQTFAFNGANVTTNDGRLRYPFVATISVRNRSL
jgi:type IV pilus assembly protein PilW